MWRPVRAIFVWSFLGLVKVILANAISTSFSGQINVMCAIVVNKRPQFCRLSVYVYTRQSVYRKI